MTKYLVSLGVALALNAAANLMMKFGMRGIDADLAGAGILDQGVGGLIRLLLRNWVLLAGLGCFALNVVFYTYALQKLPISMAYPVMTVTGFAIIVVVSGYLLSERLTALQWVGVAAILIGAVCVARDAGRQMGSPTGQKRPPSADIAEAK